MPCVKLGRALCVLAVGLITFWLLYFSTPVTVASEVLADVGSTVKSLSSSSREITGVAVTMSQAAREVTSSVAKGLTSMIAAAYNGIDVENLKLDKQSAQVVGDNA